MPSAPDWHDLWKRLATEEEPAMARVRKLFIAYHAHTLAAKSRAANRVRPGPDDYEAWADEAVRDVCRLARKEPLRHAFHGVLRKTALFAASRYVSQLLPRGEDTVEPTFLTNLASAGGGGSPVETEVLEALYECIRNLPTADRDLITGHHLDGRQKQDLLPGFHPATAGRRLRKAYDALLHCLRQKGISGDHV
jgi:hypothetical protein